ncbi:MAG: aldo/keto reductase [Nakamurella sp.]
MQSAQIGATGVHVSEIGFGSAGIGNLYRSGSDDDAEAAIEASWQAGIRYFDTAPHYGLGLAETRLGRALAGRPRADFVLSTKVGRLLVPNPRPTGTDLAEGGFDVPDEMTRLRDYSRDGVLRSLEASLDRLGTDHVDIALVHDPDDHVSPTVREALPTLVALRDQGVIGAVGIGMNQWQVPLQVLAHTDLDVVMLASRWTLIDRSGQPLMQECARRGVSVLAAAPYNSGLLATDWPDDDERYDYRSAPVELVHGCRDLARTAQEHGSSLPDLALQFPLRHPATAGVVVSLRTAEEVDAALRRSSATIPTDLWVEIDKKGLVNV